MAKLCLTRILESYPFCRYLQGRTTYEVVKVFVLCAVYGGQKSGRVIFGDWKINQFHSDFAFSALTLLVGRTRMSH